MATGEQKSLPFRTKVAELAISQVGCHYVNGAAGNRPGQSDGAWYRPDAVKLHPNRNDSPKGKGEFGRYGPIIQAAYCTVHGNCVCGGRSAKTDLPKGDFDADLIIYDDYKWPRPDGQFSSTATIWGESCEGVRHFDCIGFVNWCLSEIIKPVQYGIANFEKHKYEPVDPKVPGGEKKLKQDLLTLDDVRVGDLLLKGKTHIGFAVGDGWVVHASGYKSGVVKTKVKDNNDHNGATWDFVYRFPDSFWY